MKITAKFPGKCAACGKPTRTGDTIEYAEKKAYHLDCAPSEQPANLVEVAEAEELAERLGFTR